ncbi:MAG TPA: ATP-binding protein [Acidimicrobiales bacterium]|nr:ATP-binding protein [Acidimicrobiales bacterium]
MRFRPTIRLRLTLLYGGLFLAAGAVLLAVNYALVRRGLDEQIQPVQVRLAEPGTRVVENPLGNEVFVAPNPFAEDPADVFNRLQERVRDKALHELVVQSGLALGLMAVASVGLGWLIAGRVLRPLQHVTATARQLSEANLDRRLDLQGPRDELKELADTFDDMLERLQRAFESQRRFVANASHELRTPLAVQRTLIDVALADPDATKEELRAMAVSVSDAIDRSEHLIDSLLVLARSEQGLARTEDLDLAQVAARAVDQLAAEAERWEVRIERVLGHAPVRGNAVLLERLVANLVQNGVRYNHRGGWVEVTTRVDAGRAAVEVRNSGPVVPPGDVEGLFEPFRRRGQDRVDSARGVGLGLSIVRAVARAHGGAVTAEAPPAGGLSVRVELPSPAPRERTPARSLTTGTG